MRYSKSEGIKLAAGTALSLTAIALVLRDVDISTMARAVANVDYGLALTSFLTFVLALGAKAVRWSLLLGSSQSLRYSRALTFLIIGQMINAAFPLRFGELGRIYLAAEKEEVSGAVAAGSIVLEKTIDAAILVVSLTIIMPLILTPAWIIQPALLSAASTGTMLIAVVLVLRNRRRASSALVRIRRAVSALARRASVPSQASTHDGDPSVIRTEGEAAALDQQISALLLAMREIGDLRPAAVILAWSAIIWLLSVATNYLAFLAMGLNLPLLAAIFLLIVIQVGVMVPSAPGRVGLFQAATVLALAPFSLDATRALGYSMLLYAIVFLPVVVAGPPLLWREHISLSRYIARNDIGKALRQLATAARGSGSEQKL
ncbi:MAG: flippase-like domain-containing protein [Chloroflexi bacterium]|nr:flippase-like domain-containing protein [Chloroflexota bacterium]